MIDALRRAGFEGDDAPSRAALVDRVTGAMREATGANPHWRWFIPGRIEIFGKHTDYAGGRSLLAAVPRGFAIAASPRPDDVVRVIDARYGQTALVNLAEPAADVSNWPRYVSVVAHRLARNFPGAPLGADIAIASDLPRAAGLSSSSALVVGVATALIRRGGLLDRPESRLALPTLLDLAGYLGAVENGLTFGSLSGTSGVGTHGGSEDHTAILACRTGHVSAYAFVPVRHLADARMPDAWRFVVSASGIEADKAGSARDRYNRASLATRALVDVWNASEDESRATLASVLDAAPDAAARLREIAARARHPDFGGEDLTRRLAHFIGEDSRILPAIGAFGDADAAAIGALSMASQQDAGELLGNQIPETQELARLARECGAFGASSFGAGFGGSVWALVAADDAESFGSRWTGVYRAQFPQVGAVEWFVARPGPSVVEL